MNDYVLTTCSTADLSPEYFRKIRVPYICFHYELGNESREDDLWTSIDPHTFYQRMLNGENSRTSQVNMTEYISFWRPFLQEGKDVLHLFGQQRGAPQAGAYRRPPEKAGYLPDTGRYGGGDGSGDSVHPPEKRSRLHPGVPQKA